MPKKPDADPRHKPFIDFAFDSYRERRQETLVITGREIGAVAQMLKATKAHPEEFALENLQRAWLCFLAQANEFERRQPPLTWFCTHLNPWLARSRNGKAANSTEVMKTWLRTKINPSEPR